MDPEYDVVGNLPARVRKHYADDPDTGLGNVPIEAEEDYYHKAKLEMQARGVNWKMFTFLPRVLEHYDEHNCKYYTAIPDGRAGTVLDKEVAETGVEYDFWDACLAEPEALPQDRGSSDPPATLESRGPEDAPLDPRPLTLDPFPMHSAAHCVASPAAAGRGP